VDRGTLREVVLTLQTLPVEWAEAGQSPADHLHKRLAAGDLLPGSSLDDLERIARAVACDRSTLVLVDRVDARGEAVVLFGRADDRRLWFVKVDRDARLWTLFPPEREADYLMDPRYHRVGTVAEVESWTND
jgi:hypothetical protein